MPVSYLLNLKQLTELHDIMFKQHASSTGLIPSSWFIKPLINTGRKALLNTIAGQDSSTLIRHINILLGNSNGSRDSGSALVTDGTLVRNDLIRAVIQSIDIIADGQYQVTLNDSVDNPAMLDFRAKLMKVLQGLPQIEHAPLAFFAHVTAPPVPLTFMRQEYMSQQAPVMPAAQMGEVIAQQQQSSGTEVAPLSYRQSQVLPPQQQDSETVAAVMKPSHG